MSVDLKVNGRLYRNWSRYSVTSDLYQADGSFDLTIKPGANSLHISEGAQCRVIVDGLTAMTGIIDVIDESSSRSAGLTVRVTGRDLMGLVIDEYCTSFRTYVGWSIRKAAETLLAPIPIISRRDIVFEAGADALAVPRSITQVQPGATVFETLRAIAASRGLIFYCRPDGALVFGVPAAAGRAQFALTRQAGKACNILSGGRTRNLAARWRTVRVLGQQQGTDEILGEDIAVDASATDDEHPLPHKTFVAVYNDDGTSAARQAKLILERQRREGYRLRYTTRQYTQAGKLWRVNALCDVVDDDYAPPVRGTYLVYSRTFVSDNVSGSRVDVSLGFSGIAA